MRARTETKPLDQTDPVARKGTVTGGAKPSGWAVSLFASVFRILLPNIETILGGGRV